MSEALKNTQARSVYRASGLAVILIAVAHALLRLRDIDIQVATYAVSSPLNFIWLNVHPGLANLDWPAGAADFRFSLPMVGLLALVEQFGLDPTGLVWPFGFCQIVAFVAAVAYLAHVLFRDATCTVAIAAVVAVCPIAGVNFGNFGAGIGNQNPVLFYTLANAWRIAGLAFFLQRRYWPAVGCLLVACYTHLTLGLFMLVFIGAGLLASHQRLTDRHLWHATAGLCAGLLPLAWRIASGSTVTTGEIPLDDWVLMSQLFNWHWHPVTLGLFGPYALLALTPMVFLAGGCLVARRSDCRPGDDLDRLLMGGIAGVLAVSMVGIALSDVRHVPIVMKLAPQRASELASLTLLCYYVAFLVSRIRLGAPLERACAAWALVLLVASKSGVGLLPLCVLAIWAAVRGRHPMALGVWTVVTGILLLLTWITSSPASTSSSPLAHMLLDATARLPAPLPQLGMPGAPDYLVQGGGFAAPYLWCLALAAPLLALVPRRTTASRSGATAAAGGMFLLVAGFGIMLVVASGYARWETWATLNRARGAAYLELQRWAFAHTAPEALFMGDPARATGWREYSARAYFGSIAELAHFATLYDSAPQRFAEGLARIRAFGVDPLTVDRAAVAGFRGGKYGISVLAPAISEAFNTMPEPALLALARRFGVTHLIIETQARPTPLTRARLVHRNRFYRVYAVARVD